jgi:nucleotide-binding universal stress UspA family protein
MSDTTNEATVPITVPCQASDSDEDPSGYDGEVIHHPDYSVVVPVVSDLFTSNTGVNARRFLQTPIALADDNDGQVVLLGIAVVEHETALEQIREYAKSDDEGGGEEQFMPEVVTERQSQLVELLNVAKGINQDLPVRAVVRVVTDTTQGILAALGDGSETAVLLLRRPGFDEGWLLGNETVDTVVAEAECDVFVENVGGRGGPQALYVPDVESHTVASLAESEGGTFDSILLPVGTGPHSALAAEAARAVARKCDASVTVLHAIDPNASGKERSDAKDLLTFAEYVLGPKVASETELRETSNPTDVIIEAAQNHDFTSIGFPEQKFKLRNLIFKPLQKTLAGKRDVTVVMGRDADRTTRSLYYRYRRAMENSDTDERSG